MKKTIALILAALTLALVISVVSAETLSVTASSSLSASEDLDTPVYQLVDVAKNGNTISGKVVLVSGKKAEGEIQRVRVIMFAGNTYIHTTATMYSDNTFELHTNLPMDHVTCVLQGRDANGEWNRYTAIGFDVQ